MESPDSPANQAGAGSPEEVTPQEVYDRMAKYLAETESLITLLRDSLSKGEAQLTALTTFDSRVSQLGNNLNPIDTSSLQTEIDDVRKHIVALQELRDQVKADMEKVKKISERIVDIVNQYQNVG